MAVDGEVEVPLLPVEFELLSEVHQGLTQWFPSSHIRELVGDPLTRTP